MDTELKVELFEPDSDVEQIDDLTQHLRNDLLELDVDSVSPASAGEAPPGSRGVELAAIGALIVSLKGSVELAEKVVSAVRSWLHRGQAPDRTVRLTVDGRTLELSAATDAQQQQLVDEFVRAMAAR